MKNNLIICKKLCTYTGFVLVILTNLNNQPIHIHYNQLQG